MLVSGYTHRDNTATQCTSTKGAGTTSVSRSSHFLFERARRSLRKESAESGSSGSRLNLFYGVVVGVLIGGVRAGKGGVCGVCVTKERRSTEFGSSGSKLDLLFKLDGEYCWRVLG